MTRSGADCLFVFVLDWLSGLAIASKRNVVVCLKFGVMNNDFIMMFGIIGLLVVS